MKSIIKSKVKIGLQRLGINISYANDEDYNPQMYMDILKGAISVKKPLNIIQVGANDGEHNDPIYNFVKNHKESTNIILIEPIEDVIPYLKDNYSYHPSSEIINKAIDNSGSESIRLYGVDQSYWGDINAEYGKNWPDYRIPTGVTTTNRDQILDWVSRNIQSDANPENIIKNFDVKTTHPDSVIRESQIMNDIQLLQVDAEGMDDRIVYSFLESDAQPNIINIERKHLSQEREKKYDKKMKRLGYNLYNYTSSEKLALK